MKRLLSLFVTVLLLSVSAFAQNVGISGTVKDPAGEPLVGVSVLVKGTTTGIMTDVDGTFSLNVPADAVLEISSIGFITQDITVGSQRVFDITLQEDSELLDATVVIGYGTVKRTNFTGSVATYSVGEGPASNLNRTNALEMLRGMAPGLSMSQSGVAGSQPSMQIRGQKSISGGSSPLIVLDGVIFKGSMMDIDPSTVESMSVMKDATSLAAYGSQAANGVIMITSKKGTVGKPTINFRGSVAIVEQNYHPEIRNGEQYIELYNARQELPAGTIDWLTDLERKNYLAGKETDWVKFMEQTGVRQDYSLNVSGGTEAMNYLFGVSYSDNTNFIKGNEFIRETVTARINSRISKHISAGINFNWSNTQNDGVRPNYTRYFTPYGDPYMEDGKTLRRYLAAGGKDDPINPLWNVYAGVDAEQRGNSSTLGGNIEVKFPWVEGLSYKITGTFTLGNMVNRRFTHENNFVELSDIEYNSAVYDKYLSSANGYINNNKSTSYVLDNILTYTRDLGAHYINATLVYTRDYTKSDGSQMTGTGFVGLGNTSKGFYGLNNADIQTISSITYSLHTDVGYLARVNYSYADKYHFNASFRRDGSSVFGSNHKWGNFPAVGVAWTISDEPFFKGIKPVDYLKIKASWGKNGNQSIAPYGTLSRMNMGKSGGTTVWYGNEYVYAESMATLGNPDLGWETTTSWNYGFEADLFGRFLHWEVDAYKSKTTDQIFNRTIPVMGAGITSQSATMGRVDNWGVESSMRFNLLSKKDFNWTATLNFTMNRNKLVELYGDGQDDITNNLFLGKSLGAIYGYRLIGIVQEDDTDYLNANGATPGDAKFANLDGSEDNRITATDREILGFNKENFRMSLASTFSWKDLTLYVMFNGIFSGNGYGLAENAGAYQSYEGMQYLNTVNHPYWTKENKSNKYPRAKYSGNNNSFLQPYGFVRLQDVNLSYNLRAPFLKKVGIASVQCYVSGNNLFFIAPKWEFSDPEVRSFRSQQLARTYTFGLNVRF